MNSELIRKAKPGDKVRFLRPNGIGRNGVEYKEAVGRVVIKNPDSLVLNCGGRYGIPAVVDAKNIVAVVGK